VTDHHVPQHNVAHNTYLQVPPNAVHQGYDQGDLHHQVYYQQQQGSATSANAAPATSIPISSVRQDVEYPPTSVQYIQTPPPAVPGVFPSVNPPPFTRVPRSITAANPSTRTAIRFQCRTCGQTFSRDHDRKRHYESQHAENPPVYRCDSCHKDFARADSLRRHVRDGGCDGSRRRVADS